MRQERSCEGLISAVLPVYNEVAILEKLTGLLIENLEKTGHPFEIVYVNDGSRDGSEQLLDQLAEKHPEVRVIHFSRNFGHQAATQAGLVHASGEAIIIMDSDLQDDPAAIPQFIEKWKEGYDVVYAVRFGRKEGPIKRLLFHSFYRVLNWISQTPIPMDAGNFGLVDRSAADSIAHLIDRDRYFPGLRRWVGYKQTGIPVERLARHDKNPRITIQGLFKLAKAAIFSFSSFPLSMFYFIATMSLLACLGLVGFSLYHRLFTGLAVPGWTSITMTASFFGALNALGIGILGEYVIRIYDQVRARPLFIVARRENFGTGDERVRMGANKEPAPVKGNNEEMRMASVPQPSFERESFRTTLPR